MTTVELVQWSCPDCGFTVMLPKRSAHRKVHHPCKQLAEPGQQRSTSPPPLGQRAVTYAQALARWQKNGRPTRSDEEVARIMAEFCHDCGFFGDGRCNHRSCGCRVNQSRIPLVNKLRMATEGCPLNLWQPQITEGSKK